MKTPDALSLEERLQRLEDERDILHTMSVYGHSVDYGHEAEFMDCWATNAIWELPMRPAPLIGKAEILAAFRAHTHAPQARHKHIMVEPLIRVEDGKARVQSMFARLDRYSGKPNIRNYGRYVDELTRCGDGRWRFTQRKVELEAMREDTPDFDSAASGS